MAPTTSSHSCRSAAPQETRKGHPLRGLLPQATSASAVLPVTVAYARKRSSSGRLEDGRILLTVTSLAPREVREDHIARLTASLTAKAQKLLSTPIPGIVGGTVSDPIRDHAALEALVADVNSRFYGFTYSSVGWSRQNRRWGSCSTRLRRIHISHRLVGAPRELVEYVVAHELCHLAEANHGRAFWELVARANPDFAERRRQLGTWALLRAGLSP